MLKIASKKVIALGCLTAGLVSGAAGVLVAQAIVRAQYLNTSLFVVTTDQEARFSVSLDDRRDGPAAGVQLQLLDASGAVVASQNVVLQPGASSTLRVPGPGSFRAHASVVDGTTTAFSDRRSVSGSVEIIDTLTGIVRPTCSFIPGGLPPGR
jgi:hypothetical protein